MSFARKLQRMLALGLTASVGTPLLLWPLASLVSSGRLSAVGLVCLWLIDRLWLLLVLPLLGWLAGRFVSAEPWPTAIGSALVGEAYYVALDAASTGAAGWSGVKYAAWRVATLLGGIYLTRWAILRGRKAGAGHP